MESLKKKAGAYHPTAREKRKPRPHLTANIKIQAATENRTTRRWDPSVRRREHSRRDRNHRFAMARRTAAVLANQTDPENPGYSIQGGEREKRSNDKVLAGRQTKEGKERKRGEGGLPGVTLGKGLSMLMMESRVVMTSVLVRTLGRKVSGDAALQATAAALSTSPSDITPSRSGTISGQRR